MRYSNKYLKTSSSIYAIRALISASSTGVRPDEERVLQCRSLPMKSRQRGLPTSMIGGKHCRRSGEMRSLVSSKRESPHCAIEVRKVAVDRYLMEGSFQMRSVSMIMIVESPQQLRAILRVARRSLRGSRASKRRSVTLNSDT